MLAMHCELKLGSAEVPQKYMSLSAARWALATLNSRTMFLEGHPAGVLMPFGDLHNHSPPPGPQLPDLGAPQSTARCAHCIWVDPAKLHLEESYLDRAPQGCSYPSSTLTMQA